MKKNLIIWIFSGFCAALFATALILTHGALKIVLCFITAAAWMAFFIRFRTLEYRITDDGIGIRIGIFFRSEITLKRAAILSQSRYCLGKYLICTIVRTAGKTTVLFCEIPENFT
ncbi:MAG: hypothetical protein K2N56_12030 [Oscillospiraceae bacterium]|nr:hypothetical protein [Oscillospiraceae bacterium]